MSNQSKSPFLESVRDLMRVKHLSYRTEEAYLGWIRRFILFHEKRHPKRDGRGGSVGVSNAFGG